MNTMATAKLIKDHLPSFRGHAALYKVSPPVKSGYDWTPNEEREEYEYIVVSKAHHIMAGSETYVFPADAEGTVVAWRELEGSRKGQWSHHDILEQMGYMVEN